MRRTRPVGVSVQTLGVFVVVCRHGDSSQNFDWLILCQMHWVTFGY